MEKSVMKPTKKGFAPFKNQDTSVKTMPKKFSKQAGGEMYKKPVARGKGTIAASGSSSKTSPEGQSSSDKKMYSKSKQPIQYSNVGEKPTKFIN